MSQKARKKLHKTLNRQKYVELRTKKANQHRSIKDARVDSVNVFLPGYGPVPVHRIYTDSHCFAMARPSLIGTGHFLAVLISSLDCSLDFARDRARDKANLCRFTVGLDRICCPQYTCKPTIWQMLDA